MLKSIEGLNRSKRPLDGHILRIELLLMEVSNNNEVFSIDVPGDLIRLRKPLSILNKTPMISWDCDKESLEEM